MVNPDSTLVIADFGQAELFDKPGVGSTLINQGGTYSYAPPETNNIRREHCGKYDIWSLGCVFLEFVAFVCQGRKGLENLDNVRRSKVQGTHSEDDRFYSESIQDGVILLKETVVAWINNLSKSQNSERSQLFVKKMLSLVKLMLTVDAKERVGSQRLVYELEQLVKEHSVSSEAFKELPRAYTNVDDPYLQLNESLSKAWHSATIKKISRAQHNAVHILLLYWDPHHTVISAEEDVNALSTVLKETYGFEVAARSLDRTQTKRLQTQLTKIMADWVYDNDGPGKLLVAYYAGHGGDDTLDGVAYKNIGYNLTGIESDVLQIFDCCYRGGVGSRRSRDSTDQAKAQLNQCIFASPETTKRPGIGSLTFALTWALKELAINPAPFSTSDLLHKTMEAPQFSKYQKPVFTSHTNSSFENFSLGGVKPPALTESQILPVKEILTLHFHISRPLTSAKVETLARGFTQLDEEHDLGFSRIVWGALR